MRHAFSRTVEQDFERTYIDSNGVIRWTSSNNVPPIEILTEFLVAGLVDLELITHSQSVAKQEDIAFLEAYVANRKKHGYSDEEKFEMRAAFGNEEVVDIFTGKTITL